MIRSILLHVAEDEGFEGRLQAALDLCRACDAHLTCLQVTPYNAYVAFDPLGGVHAVNALVDDLRQREAETEAAISARLEKEDVRWDWAHADGDVVQMVSAWSSLSDLVVISQAGSALVQGIARFPDLVVMASECPVLVVPAEGTGFAAGSPAIIGWNATPEAARALRGALPILAQASSVTIVTVGESDEDLPQMAASAYLSRHGIASELIALTGKGSDAETELLRVAREKGAGVILMGAYGRSRLREALLGGATRTMLDQSEIAVLMKH